VYAVHAPRNSILYRVFIENHDHARVVSRFGNDSPAWRAISAKMLAVLEVTQTGTVYVYQGQELGMKNFPRTWGIEEYKDVASQNYWQLCVCSLGGVSPVQHLTSHAGSRDRDRKRKGGRTSTWKTCWTASSRKPVTTLASPCRQVQSSHRLPVSFLHCVSLVHALHMSSRRHVHVFPISCHLVWNA
jgi:glycosidase